MTKSDSMLHELAGEEVCDISFSFDVIAFEFQTNGFLQFFLPPTIEITGRILSSGQVGYRDALVERLGHVVTSTAEDPDNELRIIFDDGAILRLSLRLDDQIGPEAAMLTLDNSLRTTVW